LLFSLPLHYLSFFGEIYSLSLSSAFSRFGDFFFFLCREKEEETGSLVFEGGWLDGF